MFFLRTHIAKVFLHICLLEIPRYPIQQWRFHYKLYLDGLRRQPFVEKKSTRKTTNKKLSKIGKAKENSLSHWAWGENNFKTHPINPQWKPKTKITLKLIQYLKPLLFVVQKLSKFIVQNLKMGSCMKRPCRNCSMSEKNEIEWWILNENITPSISLPSVLCDQDVVE